MIGRAEIEAAFDAQVESITDCVATVGAENTVWAVNAAADVDAEALIDAGMVWERMTAGAPVSEATAFVAGFLVALRLERSVV